jgi:exopolysaccharide biosynthesis predicted pyruvyltransferase EpsI
MPNPGNVGDRLIHQGTRAFFHRINLEHTETTAPPSRPVGTFIYGGGGSWCHNWPKSPQRVEQGARHAHTTIVLPSTFELETTLYNDPTIHFFCRDRYNSQRTCPRATFAHDMAFHLKNVLQPQQGSGVGYFMRTDREKRVGTLPPNNNDISITTRQPRIFIRIINRCRVIHTDRLHVAIIACMLDKKVLFYPGNYFKNKAVYLSSLKDKYDVTFRE